MTCYGAISVCFRRLTTGFRDSESLVNPESGFKNFFFGKTLGMTENEQKNISRGLNASEFQNLFFFSKSVNPLKHPFLYLIIIP